MNNPSAIVGYTGLVGSHLDEQLKFGERFNSKNSNDMNGRKFSTVFFSAAPAEKWRANLNPEDDARTIESLISLIQTFRADRFVLISTIDVYDPPIGVDEKSRPDLSKLQAYGLNRLKLEHAVEAKFKDVTILRLPALFGKGLKKNAIFDLITGNQIEKIDSRGQFQFYDLRNIGMDSLKALSLGIPLLNICSKPIQIGKVANDFFGIHLSQGVSKNPASYDVRSIHSEFWGDRDYLYSQESVLRGLREFLKNWK